ncbi:MAG: hypothetical protein Q8N47_13555 [Bryobacterales bacterium]|nr:hypothetical protein [Bryobacterales bacterium]
MRRVRAEIRLALRRYRVVRNNRHAGDLKPADIPLTILRLEVRP